MPTDFFHKGYYQLPKTGSPTHQVFRHTRRQDFTLTGVGDKVYFMVLPKLSKPTNFILSHGDHDTGTGAVGKLMMTNGGTPIQIMASLNIQAAGVKDAMYLASSTPFDPVAWHGRVLGGANTWKVYFEVTTTAGTAFQAANLSLLAIYSQDLEDGEKTDAITGA